MKNNGSMSQFCCFCDKPTSESYSTEEYWSNEESRQGYGIKYVCCFDCYTRIVKPEQQRKEIELGYRET